jgi:hypothetical protein
MAALNLVLLGAIALAWLSGRSDWEPPRPIAPDPALFAPPVAPAGTMAEGVGLHARPLFAASRRPAPASAGTAEQADAGDGPPTSIDAATLVGLVGGGELGVALVSLDGEIRRVPVGGLLAGWRLTAIRGLTASFSNDAGEQREMSIKPPARDLQSAVPSQAEAGEGAQAGSAGGNEPPSAGAAAADGLQAKIAERQRRRALLRKHREDQ